MRRIEIHRENGGGGERDRGGRGNGEEREREKWIKEKKKISEEHFCHLVI